MTKTLNDESIRDLITVSRDLGSLVSLSGLMQSEDIPDDALRPLGKNVSEVTTHLRKTLNRFVKGLDLSSDADIIIEDEDDDSSEGYDEKIVEQALVGVVPELGVVSDTESSLLEKPEELTDVFVDEADNSSDSELDAPVASDANDLAEDAVESSEDDSEAVVDPDDELDLDSLKAGAKTPVASDIDLDDAVISREELARLGEDSEIDDSALKSLVSIDDLPKSNTVVEDNADDSDDGDFEELDLDKEV